MASFHSDRLPVNVEQGAEGGPGFKTTILTLADGSEQRQIEWARVRGTWDVAYGIQSKEDIEPVQNHFYARNGRGYGFPFKDWIDFEMELATIAIGDNTTVAFQIYKPYTSGGYTYFRKLTRIVTGTVVVKVNGVTKTETTHYTVGYDTGIITFTGGNTPATSAVIAVSCEFNVPVRYDTDTLKIRITWEDAMEVPTIPLLELKE